MRRYSLLFLSMLLGLAGCSSPRVSVDSRLTPDSAAWRHLDGPAYRIVGPNPQVEASLEFQESATLLELALREPRPNLARAVGPSAGPGTTEHIVFSLSYQVIDRGTAVESYPVYGHRSTTVYSRHGAVYRGYSSGYAGQAVETVHLGFAHTATLSAWVPDRSQPAGRLVVWEGSATLLSETPDMRASMPYLAVALAEFYGQPSEGQAVVKFKRHDGRIERLRGGPVATTMPANVQQVP